MKNCLTTFAFLLLMAYGVRAETQRGSEREEKIRINLESGWRFREAGKDAWHTATVPGCVHTDLLANKLIDDPFYRDNEQKLQWIGKTDWEYQTTFNVSPELLSRQHVELVFEGLDTYAEVFLNGVSVLKADNMFRTWRADAKATLKAGSNSLVIRFRSPVNEVLPVMAKMSYQLPSPNDQGEKTSPHTRKAPYHYGWDWGPRFVTSGVWKPVHIEAWNGARIADLHVSQKRVNSSAADLTAEVEIISDAAIEATVIVDDLTSRRVAAQSKVRLTAGTNRVPLNFVIARPALWWPNGLGAQPLYRFRARLLMNGRLTDVARVRTGLRSLELRQQPDQWGKSFEFRINGVPVFAKGGNWIPADSFPTRVTREKYRHMLASVRDTNMNMLRVWGGGIYESDEFYELCDEMGILVWQDFMFACAMYPGTPEFLENVRAEATDNVKRLRNHPSLVIWAGNNEVETAWQHWGWKQSLPASLWDDYLKIFHGVLKEVCAALDPERPYWPSSPSSNLEDDPDSEKIGDVHFWRVWHFAEPFTNYEQQFPRFMSEYGFQSFPQIETVSTYTLPSERDIESRVMLAHQRHPRGNQLIREYMLREYPAPKDFESFLYVSQVLQAEGIKIGAEHFRRSMPRNMGSLYWQINDCWPVASWSGIDYYGRWKALHYYARRFYDDLLLSSQRDKDAINFYVVSDRTEATPAQLRVSLLDFDGRVLTSTVRNVTVAPLKSNSYLSIPLRDLLQGRDTKSMMLYGELIVGGKAASSNSYFFEPYKNLSAPTARISTTPTPTRGGFKITLSSDKFAKAVYLSVPDADGFFSDNYFDLVPGKTVEVEFRPRTRLTLAELRGRLKVRSMSDAF
ncbi:MAG TPA: glycoside hydrolase family 2 protein [Pyrinomonadaceae bacterium]